MSKMNIDKSDRPKVKAECLRLLATLKVNPAKMQLISGFIDTYLKLNQAEQKKFNTEVNLFKQEEKEEVMQIVTSWMQEGIEQGIKQGIEQGIEQGIKQRIEQEKDLILRMLRRKLGEIDTRLETKVKRLKIKQLELLAEELLDFSSLDDLQAWLDKKSKEKKNQPAN
jgi:hypothetical protein